MYLYSYRPKDTSKKKMYAMLRPQGSSASRNVDFINLVEYREEQQMRFHGWMDKRKHRFYVFKNGLATYGQTYGRMDGHVSV